MKTTIKIITILFIALLFSCSSDDEKILAIEDIDPTNYVIAGKMLNNHVAIVTFASNDKASIRTTDLNIEADYTVDGDTVKIENYGYVKIQNNSIVYSEMDLMEFDDAKLLQKASQNVFKNKDFSGTIANSQFQIPFFVRFSDSGALHGAGETFEQANPNLEFNIIGNTAGIYLNQGFSHIFYYQNNKLVYEAKAIIGVQGTHYLYSEELALQPQ